jgi:hypothetical protein
MIDFDRNPPVSTFKVYNYNSLSLKIDTVRSSETSEGFNRSTWGYKEEYVLFIDWRTQIPTTEGFKPQHI